MPKPVSL